jgi:hypothetical protein
MVAVFETDLGVLGWPKDSRLGRRRSRPNYGWKGMQKTMRGDAMANWDSDSYRRLGRR